MQTSQVLTAKLLQGLPETKVSQNVLLINLYFIVLKQKLDLCRDIYTFRFVLDLTYAVSAGPGACWSHIPKHLTGEWRLTE